MFDEFNTTRKKRSISSRYECDGFTPSSKCFVSGGDGGGGSSPSQQTMVQTNIPEYAKPYVEGMLGIAQQQVYDIDSSGNITGIKGYTPYSSNAADYFAPFSPLQQQAQANAASLEVPGQFGMATPMAYGAGAGSMQAADQARMLGQTALAYGESGAGYGAAGSQYGAAGARAAQEAASQANLDAQRFGQSAANVGQQGLGYGRQAAGYGAGAQGLGQQATQIAMQQGLGYGGQGAGYGAAAAGLAPAAQAYGQNAANIGAQGVGAGAQAAAYGARGAQAAEQGFGAGAQYARQATDPGSIAAYMSPYQQQVTDYQKSQAIRDYNIAQQGRKAQAVGAGAFGGSRQAIAESEAQRNLQSQLQGIQATGSQQAFQNAQQAQQFGANLGLQGLQAGYQGLGQGIQGQQAALQGLSTGMQGQQAALQGLGQAGQMYGLGMQGSGLGLQGLQGALAGSAQGMQGYQTGIQGAQAGIAGISPALQGYQTGLQGVGQQISAGNLGLAGTAQGIQGAQAGMQGAQAGMQGVQGATQAGQYGLAGYGQGLQAALGMGQLGTQQLAAQQGVIGTQNQYGGMQQAAQQAMINQAIQNYAMQQQYPQQQLAYMSGLLRGLPMQQATTSSYQAAPSMTSQLTGLGMTGLAASQLIGKKKGGMIDRPKSGLDDLGIYEAMKGTA